jgi:hypothetical protein
MSCGFTQLLKNHFKNRPGNSNLHSQNRCKGYSVLKPIGEIDKKKWGFNFFSCPPERLFSLFNACPSERLFSLFNATYDDDQKSSYTDYIELSMQSQFNKRDL